VIEVSQGYVDEDNPPPLECLFRAEGDYTLFSSEGFCMP
jgi:hypothetical protein